MAAEINVNKSSISDHSEITIITKLELKNESTQMESENMIKDYNYYNEKN